MKIFKLERRSVDKARIFTLRSFKQKVVVGTLIRRDYSILFHS